MVTKPKSNSVITHKVNDNGTLTFTVRGAGEFTFDPSKASDVNRNRAQLHGWTQRISDGGAMSRDPVTGASATPGDKLARMQSLAAHYESGTEEWSLKAGPRPFDAALVILGMIRGGKAANGDDAERKAAAIAAKLNVDREGALRVIATSKAVAAAMAEIRAERNPGSADADSMLDEIE